MRAWYAKIAIGAVLVPSLAAAQPADAGDKPPPEEKPATPPADPKPEPAATTAIEQTFWIRMTSPPSGSSCATRTWDGIPTSLVDVR